MKQTRYVIQLDTISSRFPFIVIDSASGGLIAESRTAVIRLPPRSPNLNAYAERFVRSIKEECLDRMIFFGQVSLRRAVSEFVVHYHRGRNHQGIENRLIQPGAALLMQRPNIWTIRA